MNESDLNAEIERLKHTIGPLTVRRAATGGDVAISERDRNIVAECYAAIRTRRERSDDEAMANAILFAAAADLLDACRLALNAFERADAIDWSILERAIAKATTQRVL